MAREMRNQRLLFNLLVRDLEPGVRDAFYAVVDNLRSGVDWKALLAALQTGDVEGAVAALRLQPEAFHDLATAMTGAYASGGAMAATTISGPGGARTLFRFNMKNPVAEQWIRNEVGDRIVGNLIPETVAVVRSVIEQGYSRGEHPFTIALDIAGRVQGKGSLARRAGGILPLDGPRAARLHAVTVGMRSAEGVRGLVVMGEDGVLTTRYKVNAATKQRIMSAYRNGTAVPEAQRAVSEVQYSNLLLKARADTIARTETGQAVMSGRYEAWRQAAAAEGYDDTAISKTWRHGSSSKMARPDHIAMNGKTVQGLYTPFVFPDGTMKQHALDGMGGAKHDINCGCGTDFRLDRSRGL